MWAREESRLIFFVGPNSGQNSKLTPQCRQTGYDIQDSLMSHWTQGSFMKYSNRMKVLIQHHN